jgi:hypothetical protein
MMSPYLYFLLTDAVIDSVEERDFQLVIASSGVVASEQCSQSGGGDFVLHQPQHRSDRAVFRARQRDRGVPIHGHQDVAIL